MKKILFVCTGNSCRSPMAAAIAQKVFADKHIDTEIRSAGIFAVADGGASAGAIEAVKKYGADLSQHISRKVTPEELQWADLIITMTQSHKMLVESSMPGIAGGRIFTIYEYAENSDKDVQDPFMGGLDVYAECAEEIYRLVNMIAENGLC